jgi:hypothetical protein
MCPADKTHDATFFKRGVYITSYVWNLCVNNYGSQNTFKLSQFRGDAILQWEADASVLDAGGAPYYFNDFANFPDEGVSARHSRGATVGCFGGSAEKLSTEEFYALAGGNTKPPVPAGFSWRNAAPSVPNRLWCNPNNGGRGL